jgi:hypothetical protein
MLLSHPVRFRFEPAVDCRFLPVLFDKGWREVAFPVLAPVGESFNVIQFPSFPGLDFTT